MIIYNVTTNLESSIHEDWVQWMLGSHIPDVMSSGIFLEYHLLRVLSEDETEFTYSVQYLCKNLESYQQYEDIYAPALRAEFIERYKEKAISLRTLLEVIK